MRTQDELCLLCLANNADKANSHIIPKFMTKTLLLKDGKAKGYKLSTDKVDQQSIVVQSSDAEDYILCTECESYFSVIETIIANSFHHPISDRLRRHLFRWRRITTFHCCELTNISGLTFRLFVSSLIWRCAISESHVAHRYILGDEIKEQLRTLLVEFKSLTRTDFLDIVANNVRQFPFQFDLATVLDRTKTKGKLVFLHPNSGNEGFFIINEYILTYNFDINNGLYFNGQLNGNSSIESVLVKIMSLGDWNYFCNVYMPQKFASKATQFLRRTGRNYTPFRR